MMVFLAGGEAWADLLLDMGVKNILFSFFYFRASLRSGGGKAQALLARMELAQKKGYRFFLDSGAFTYQEKAEKAAHALPNPRTYFAEYRDFILEYGNLFHTIVEFDVDGYGIVDPTSGAPIGTEQVDEWTNSLLAYPNVAPKVMPVYRKHRGDAWLHSWLIDTRSPFIGIGSSDQKGLGQIISVSHRFGKFVHGFAQTRIKTDMKYTAFDSVDSTTWLRADKFGGTMIFQNNKLIVLDHLHKADRRLYKTYFERWGLDWSKIAKDDLHELRMATIVCWRELSNSYEARWAFRGAKYPYIYELHRKGTVPKEHPVITRLKREKAAK